MNNPIRDFFTTSNIEPPKEDGLFYQEIDPVNVDDIITGCFIHGTIAYNDFFESVYENATALYVVRVYNAKKIEIAKRYFDESGKAINETAKEWWYN